MFDFSSRHPNCKVNPLDRIKWLTGDSPRNNVGEYFAIAFVLDHDLSRGDAPSTYIESIILSNDLGVFYIYVEICKIGLSFYATFYAYGHD